MKFLRLQLLIAALILFAANAAFASFSYNVSIDTSSLAAAGTIGSLDFQFNPGASTSPYTATVDISGVTRGGMFGDPTTVYTQGNVSGVLPGTVTITDNNISQLNEYFHQFTYGSTLNFNLNFNGNYDSTFAFAMFSDAAGMTPALTSNQNGQQFLLTMN